MITTHVLDTATGRPAAAVPLRLDRADGTGWALVSCGQTDADGRCKTLEPAGAPTTAGRYRLRFDTAAYFSQIARAAFYPYVEVVFELGGSDAHVHVPLLLSPFGYSTYRGS
jgi:5-hydroxyisourate hydrolase